MQTVLLPRPAHHRGAPARHDRRLRAGGIAGLLLLAAAICLAWAFERPPAPVPASAPADTFSAQRALHHLERMARDTPTPVGSAAGDELRDYLTAQLRALDLDVEVQTGVGAHAFENSTITAGRAENVVATLPGRDSSGRLVLAAHYDTPTTSPGTSDDKMSAAAILEIARALTIGEPPRNDIVFLLSDGEEPGLIGAEAFARDHPYARDGGVVLNLEGPGNDGPAALYNTSSGNAALIREFARTAPHPVGESAVSEVYRLGPFNSDFTVLREHGFQGLEFGPIGGRAYYHHPNDTIANLNPASLQHQGANALALARSLGERDLGDLDATGDASFFTVYGQVVHYPVALVWPMAVLGALAVLALGVLVRARGLASVPRLLVAVPLAALPLVAAPLAAMGVWMALVKIRPAYGDLLFAEPFRPQLYRWALATVTAAVVVLWYLALRRRIGAVALATGALVWPAVFGIAMATLVPGMSYYGALAALAAAIGGIGGVLTRDRRPIWHAAAVTTGALPGAVLLSIGGRALVSVLGVGMAAAGVFYFALAGLTALPLLALVLPSTPGRRLPAVIMAGLLALTVGLTGAGLAVDRFDADHPAPAYLMYVNDADAGTALWGSVDADPPAWAARYVPDVRTDRPVTAPLPGGTDLVRTGPAEPAPLPAPELTVLDRRTEGDATVLRVRVRSHRDAYAVGVYVDRPVRTATIDVAGHGQLALPEITPDRNDDAPWPWQVQFYDPPADGIELTLRIPGSQPPRIGLSDWTNGLDGLPGYTPRPTGVSMPPAGPPTDSVIVTRVLRP